MLNQSLLGKQLNNYLRSSLIHSQASPVFVLWSAFSRKRKCDEKWGRPVNTYHKNDVRWMRSGPRGGQCLTTSTCTKNLRASFFFTGQVEYSQSYEHLESCLAMERSMMKSSTLFECGPLPPTSTALRPPDIIHAMCSQAFPNFFAALPLY